MTKQFNINELQLKYLELETLLDITNELNSFENVSVLLQEILIKSCAVLNASSGLILMQNNNSDLFQIEAEFNIDLDALKNENLVPRYIQKIKVIATGELNKAVTIQGLSLSENAKKAVINSGGKILD